MPSVEREGFEPPAIEQEKHLWNIEHAEEVVPDAWRLTYPEAKLDIPQSWVFETEHGLLVIDPGGELPVETDAERRSLRGPARALFQADETPKINAIRELERRYEQPVSGILLTHGDLDHQNNIESISDRTVPVFVGRQGRWSVLSPEKQFTATRVNTQKLHERNGRGALRVDPPQLHNLTGRDLGFQALSMTLQNERTTLLPGSHRAEKKRAFAQRLRDFPESFETNAGHLDVVPLPGHAPEEVGFYLQDRQIMVTGDLVMTSKSEQADRLNLFLGEANVYDAMDSLRKLLTMDIHQLYPAHGQPILGADNVKRYLEIVLEDATSVVHRIHVIHDRHPDWGSQKLAHEVFQGFWQRKGMSPQSQETWVISTLEDQRAHVPEATVEHS